MFAVELVLSLVLAGPTASAAPEQCVAAWADAGGKTHSASVVLDLTSNQRLEAASLPSGTSGIACPRASVIPGAEDIRVLTELGVSLGLIEEGGRALWIWAQKGQLRITVDDGALSPSEAAAVNRWFSGAQARFDRLLAER